MNKYLLILLIFLGCRTSKTINFEYIGEGEYTVKRVYLNDCVFIDNQFITSYDSEDTYTRQDTFKLVNRNWSYLFYGEYKPYLPIQNFKDNKISMLYDSKHKSRSFCKPYGQDTVNGKVVEVYDVLTTASNHEENSRFYFDRDFGTVQFYEPMNRIQKYSEIKYND